MVKDYNFSDEHVDKEDGLCEKALKVHLRFQIPFWSLVWGPTWSPPGILTKKALWAK